jgi:hypothetical protein
VGRIRQVVIASLLTILIGTVTLYRGMAIWTATPAEIWDRGFWVLFAALSTTSLVNVWAQAVQGAGVSLCGRSPECRQNALPIPVEARGPRDV